MGRAFPGKDLRNTTQNTNERFRRRKATKIAQHGGPLGSKVALCKLEKDTPVYQVTAAWPEVGLDFRSLWPGLNGTGLPSVPLPSKAQASPSAN